MSIPQTRKLLFTLITASLVMGGTQVQAQSSEEGSNALEEVIVTAQKREENILDVPISISTLSGEELTAITAGGADIRILSGRVPSLYIESSFGRLFPRFYIRGWGNTDFDINASQPVSLVYDDVVQENPILKGFPIFDTQLVEVLRGPQGTLFGRNTPAGVVHVRSRKPDSEPSGYFSADIGTDDTNFEGAIGGGFGGNWSGRLSVKYMERDDWVDNVFTGVNDALEGHDEIALRGQLMYEADNFTALLNLHYRDLEGTARLFRANIIRPGSNGGLVSDFDIDEVYIDGQNDQQMDQKGGILTLEWVLGNTTVTSITGYETLDAWSVGDIDGGFGHEFGGVPGGPGFLPFDAETGDGVSDHSQTTQEIRWASNEWGALDWTTGLFYFDETLDIYTLNFATNFGGGVNGDVLQYQDTTAWALFGSVDYDITDELLLKVGVRYSDDDKDYSAERFLSPLAFQGVPNHLGPIYAQADDSETSWDMSLMRVFSDDTNAYVRVAQGFRAPSIQGRILFGDTVSVADSETSLSYEFGVKSRFADGRGRYGANVFYYTVDDIQLTAVGGAANFNQVVNADGMTGMGFEVDGDFLITDRLLVSMGLSYNHTEIKDSDLAVSPCGAPAGCSVLDPASPSVPGAVLIDGNPLPQAPEWVFNMNARYGIPHSMGEFYILADWFYRSEVNFFLYEAREFTGPSLDELGLRIGSLFGRWDVAGYVRNLSDNHVLVGGIDFNNLTGFVNEPRRYGLEARVSFF